MIRTFAVGGLGLAITLFCGCAPTQFGADQVPNINGEVTASKDAGVPGLPASIDAIVNGFLSDNDAPPGCAVGIMINNEVAFLEGYGDATIGGAAFDTTTHAVVGSVSKTITALAVLRMMELDLLGLGDTIDQHLPGVPAAWQNITIRELLSHTSGLEREPTFDPALDEEAELDAFLPGPAIAHPGIHPRYVYYAFQQTPIVPFDPGFDARYSNAGYMILGAVIDSIARNNEQLLGSEHSTYESFVWRQIGLFDNSLSNDEQLISICLNEYWRSTDIPNLATGYDVIAGGANVQNFSTSALLQFGPAGWEGPPGGWTMTIGDLTRLMVAIQNNSIISAGTTTQMMAPLGSDGSGNWGLGVNLINKLGRPVYMHDGRYPGFKARYTVWPGEDFGVAIMCNEWDANVRDMTDAIAREFIGDGSLPFGPGIDDNDPGLSASTASQSNPPVLTPAAVQLLTNDLMAMADTQRDLIMKKRTMRAIADGAPCGSVAQLALSGALRYDSFRSILNCVDQTWETPDFDACLTTAALDLAQQGAINTATATTLQQCGSRIHEYAQHMVGEDFRDGTGLNTDFPVFVDTAVDAEIDGGPFWVGPVEGLRNDLGDPGYNDVAMLPDGTTVFALGPNSLGTEVKVVFSAPVADMSLTVHDVETAGSLRFIGLNDNNVVVYDSGPIGDPAQAAGFEHAIEPSASISVLRILAGPTDGMMLSSIAVIPVPCPADLDGSGDVGVTDLLVLLGSWGGVAGDITGDGTTDVVDLLALLAAWGACTG